MLYVYHCGDYNTSWPCYDKHSIYFLFAFRLCVLTNILYYDIPRKGVAYYMYMIWALQPRRVSIQ